MTRGVHANSRANLIRVGGDRTKGKKLVIAAIEKALREIPDGSEIRKFFGLHAGQLLKDKHRARWAKVKAPVVYDAMVETMAGEVATSGDRARAKMIEDEALSIKLYYESMGWTGPADVEDMLLEIEERTQEILGMDIPTRYGVLNVAGFVDVRAMRSRVLYPVSAGRTAALAESQLDYAQIGLLGFSDYFGELPAEVKWANLGQGVTYLDQTTRGPTMPILHWLSKVSVSSKIRVRIEFEGSGQVEEKEVDCYARRVWALMVLPDNNYWIPWDDLPEYVTVTRWIRDIDDLLETAAELGFGGGGVLISDDGGAMTVEQWDASKNAEPSGWEFEYPVLGSGKGGSVPRIASFFPRRQRVYGTIDPVNASVVYGDLEWVDWEVWEANFGANRGAWMAAGAIVPPAVCPADRRSLAVTFDREFIAAINEGPVDATP